MRRTNTTPGHRRMRACFVLTGLTLAGCGTITERLPDFANLNPQGVPKPEAPSVSQRAAKASERLSISNPPAKEIRFQGQEKLLGAGKCQCIEPEVLRDNLAELLKHDKRRSAVAMIGLHQRSAEELLIHDLRGDDLVLDMIAATLDRDQDRSIWAEHRTACRDHIEACRQFLATRGRLVNDTNSGQSIETAGQELSDLAASIGSVPLTIETQRLRAMSQFARHHTSEAIAVLVESAETATRSGLPRLASDLWMMACEASLEAEQVQQARSCWTAAVANQLTSIRMRPSDQPLPAVDTVFWEQADRLIHPQDAYPSELVLAFSPWYTRVGIGPASGVSNDGQGSAARPAIKPQVALWASIAQFQLVTGQPHLATLSVKRAEQDADESVKPWLQIASARALAAQSQDALATSILSGLSGHENASVAAASLAAIGSMKIQSGAYEQGSGFLIRALNSSEAKQWPGKLAAKADLANVRLIVGELDEALPALHAVQNEMMIAGRWQSLTQSLENEAAILEAEQQPEQATAIRDRIAKIENKGSGTERVR